MTRTPQLGNAPWAHGAVLIGVAAVLAGVVGWALGSREWPTYLGLTLGFILLAGWVERVREQLPAPPPRRRSHLRVIKGGRPDVDLADDNSTDDQKYVM